MNPDKLFDYLDGKLEPAERADLEECLMSDEQLRRQFNVAREIHRGGGVSREVIVPDDPERGARISRRVAIAAIVLVFLNVAAGLTYIAFKGKSPAQPKRVDPAVRQQVETSMDAAAKNAMPLPSFVPAEIQLTAPRAEWESVASRIAAVASAFGGEAIKAPPDEQMQMVVADIPAAREDEFRRALTTGAPPSPAPVATTPIDASQRTIVQVRIAEAAGQ